MAKDFNSPKVVEGYDVHIRKLIPGYEVIHLQVDAILQSVLKPHAHILIVGCGTGYELEYLLKRHPDWKFTAVDPSLTMLQKAQEEVELLDRSSQVTFIHGDTSALPLEACFDAALSILVAHFVADDIKPAFFKDIYDRLKEKAVLLTYDLMTCINPMQLKALPYLCLDQGLTEEQCQKMLERMAQDFFSLTTEGYIKLLEKTGFESVQPYAQILTYQGFIAKK
ncbi:class I SAM-dependent methyltransferase [Acinetobacter seifertii]|uniref:Class I SAM-dependent methyltransferase n=2 Tax=Acinetobacter TaxID=469 RepID=A0A7H2SGT1_9GAMM|nr:MULTISPECIES: class I SAM-dependent methyltransferase [Acinetobacter]MDB0281441.1 class I SAM-dependent methyltransferase [Acinetobacter seifertii]ONN56441.1 SAM-dependent methyltransferase [Acinetobacter genomosp. 33YU]QNX10922.1 class I SAM-dependent methyltransferase [Acinetobacter seifertii]QNX21198.1 class I SAM-dependent methyltransferase [Acinetobacter seifertii]QNX27760.1 class I SAM-dependent methyltransferase [Acinetobacter seifertii]